jgi:hypothetical protein
MLEIRTSNFLMNVLLGGAGSAGLDPVSAHRGQRGRWAVVDAANKHIIGL